MVTFNIALGFVIVSTVAAFLIGWCIPISRFVGEYIAPAMGVMSFAWRSRASWFFLLFAGLAAQGIVFAAVVYRADFDEIAAGFDRSPVLFSAGLLTCAATLLMLWAGVPLRALLRRKPARAWVPTTVALGAPLLLSLFSVLCVCLTLLPR